MSEKIPEFVTPVFLADRIGLGDAVILKDGVIGFYPFEHPQGSYDWQNQKTLIERGLKMSLTGQWWCLPGAFIPQDYTVLVLQGGDKLYLPVHCRDVREWFQFQAR